MVLRSQRGFLAHKLSGFPAPLVSALPFSSSGLGDFLAGGRGCKYAVVIRQHSEEAWGCLTTR